MNLNELPKNFWTDTRVDALERDKVNKITRDFRKNLMSRGTSYSLYALTITTDEKCIREQGIWFDDDARIETCGGIYNSFIHRVSSAIEPNYKRNKHQDTRFLSWGVIEHSSKDDNERCVPHIHATVAVHPFWEERFLSCLDRNLGRDHLSLSQQFIDKQMTSLMHQIKSVRIEPIHNEYRWSAYCLKQVPHQSQENLNHLTNTGLFTHNGLTHKTNATKSTRRVGT